MPLPGQGTLSLHGYSRIGDTTTTEPKKGMIIRMSPETLEALQDSLGQPNLEVQMSENPGLWIGDKFFPMQSQTENIPHELYLRTSTAAKPNAPLKLQANVIGKFIVTPKLERIQNKMRDTLAAAEKLKEERQIQVLSEPPVLPKPSTKKAKATSTKKSAKTGAGSAAHSRVSPQDRSATPNLPPGEEAYKVYGDSSIRRRLIHCIALQPRDTAEVMRLVAGRDGGPQEKKELTEILKTCAVWRTANGQQGPDAKRTWHLMTRTWTEIRPYEWERLSDDERTRLARECRKHYAMLKIPESDPQWQHAIYRDLSKTNAAGSITSGTEPKRGIISRDVKKKKAAEAPPRKNNDTITARDERVQPNRSRPDPPPAHAGSGTVVRALRKPPGSGYKSKAGSNTPSPPDLDDSPTGPSSLPRKPDFTITSHAPQSHDRDRAPSSSNADKGSARLPPKPREPVPPASHSHAGEVKTEKQEISFKRKAPAIRDEHDTEMSDRDRDRPRPMLKRRKIGDTIGTSSTNTPAQQRTPSLPNKPSTATQDAAARPPSRSIKKEASPMPSLSSHSPLPPARSPLAHHKVSAQDRIAASSSSSSSHSRNTQSAQQSHRSGSSKQRRKSPHFTSSDEESTPPKPPRSAAPPAPTSPVVSSAPPKKSRRPRDNGPLKLPDDERSLKKLYNERYKPYMALWTKHYKAHTYITKLLEDEDASSDSDIDVDIDDQDALKQLKQDLDAAVEELTVIQEHFNKVVKSKRAAERYSDEE